MTHLIGRAPGAVPDPLRPWHALVLRLCPGEAYGYLPSRRARWASNPASISVSTSSW